MIRVITNCASPARACSTSSAPNRPAWNFTPASLARSVCARIGNTPTRSCAAAGVWAQMAKFIKESQPSFLLMMGDQVYIDEDDPNIFELHYDSDSATRRAELEPQSDPANLRQHSHLHGLGRSRNSRRLRFARVRQSDIGRAIPARRKDVRALRCLFSGLPRCLLALPGLPQSTAG